MFILDFDGLAASRGRAFDIASQLAYPVSDRIDISVGYRVIEGGADVEQVYNFAWFDSLIGSMRFKFEPLPFQHFRAVVENLLELSCYE